VSADNIVKVRQFEIRKDQVHNDLVNGKKILTDIVKSVSEKKDRKNSQFCTFFSFNKQNNINPLNDLDVRALAKDFEKSRGRIKYYKLSISQEKSEVLRTLDYLRQELPHHVIYVRRNLYTSQTEYFLENRPPDAQRGLSDRHSVDENGKDKSYIRNIVEHLRDNPEFTNPATVAAGQKLINNAKNRNDYIADVIRNENDEREAVTRDFIELAELYFAAGVKSLQLNAFEFTTVVDSKGHHTLPEGHTNVSALKYITPAALSDNRELSVLRSTLNEALYRNKQYAVNNKRKCQNYTVNFQVSDPGSPHGVLFLDDMPLSMIEDLPSNFYLIETSEDNCQVHVFLDAPVSPEKRTEYINKLKEYYNHYIFLKKYGRSADAAVRTAYFAGEIRLDPGAHDNHGRRLAGYCNRKPAQLSKCGYEPAPAGEQGYTHVDDEAYLNLDHIVKTGFANPENPALSVEQLEEMLKIDYAAEALKLQTADAVLSSVVSQPKINLAQPKKLTNKQKYTHNNYNHHQKSQKLADLLHADKNKLDEAFSYFSATKPTLSRADYAFCCYALIFDLSVDQIAAELCSRRGSMAGIYDNNNLETYAQKKAQAAADYIHRNDPNHPRFRQSSPSISGPSL
jgi:hypothetical protein